MSLVTAQGFAAELPDWLIGTWKSNEKMTLSSMNSTAGITEDAKEIFNNGFFGKLITIYSGRNSLTYYFDEAASAKEYFDLLDIDADDTTVTFRYFNEAFKDDLTTTIHRDESCFYILVSKWRFREYFCPHILE